MGKMLQSGADLRLTDESGQLPEYWARCKPKDFKKMLKYLTETYNYASQLTKASRNAKNTAILQSRLAKGLFRLSLVTLLGISFYCSFNKSKSRYSSLTSLIALFSPAKKTSSLTNCSTDMSKRTNSYGFGIVSFP